jgi:hypothetical protein
MKDVVKGYTRQCWGRLFDCSSAEDVTLEIDCTPRKIPTLPITTTFFPQETHANSQAPSAADKHRFLYDFARHATPRNAKSNASCNPTDDEPITYQLDRFEKSRIDRVRETIPKQSSIPWLCCRGGSTPWPLFSLSEGVALTGRRSGERPHPKGCSKTTNTSATQQNERIAVIA